jgi:hypothetical protein
MDPWLRRLERVVRPRLPQVLDHRLAGAFTGLLLLLLGVLLALPIPLTNYLFGGIILLFALAGFPLARRLSRRRNAARNLPERQSTWLRRYQAALAAGDPGAATMMWPT